MNTSHPPPTAQNDTLDFAPLAGGRHLLLTSTSKAVTPFAGLASFIAWLRQIGFLDRAAQVLPFSYASPNAIPIAHTFTAFLLSVVVGSSRFAHCDWLRFDSALHAMLGFKRFPGDDAILRFFARFTQGYVEAFFRPPFRWLLALLKQPLEGFTLDLDSTIFACEGSQEGAAKGYNPRRPGHKSHHPLLAVLAEAPFVLHAWLRSGNLLTRRLAADSPFGQPAAVCLSPAPPGLRLGLWSRRVCVPQGSLRATARWLALALPAGR